MSDQIQNVQTAISQSFVEGEKREGRPFSLILQLASGGSFVAPWWSKQRDLDLRDFWRKVDYLSGAIYTLETLLSSIPFRVIARDASNFEDVKKADEWTERLQTTAQWGGGWTEFFSRLNEDFLSQDNGCFAEIIGPGNPDGPITGEATSIRSLDSYRCQRTGDPIYPVVYQDIDGKYYKLHWTRVLYFSQMTSPQADMMGVGFCGVSRCINAAQSLSDILTYKQEKLGSRPTRQMLVTGGGLDPEEVRDAFRIAGQEMSNLGLQRYSRTVIVGDRNLADAKVTPVDLASLPDGFDERSSTSIGMAVISLALGTDARTLWPGMDTGATRADALISHLKSRGKYIGQMISMTEHQFNLKVLPARLRMVFDFQDDVEDKQVADVKKVRADTRKTEIDTGTVTTRVAREQMLEAGDITRAQFVQLELEDGRLEDGSPVLALFYSKDPVYRRMLDLGIPEPLDVLNNDPTTLLEACVPLVIGAQRVLANSKNQDERINARTALVALKSLVKIYIALPGVDVNLITRLIHISDPSADNNAPPRPVIPFGQQPGRPGSAPNNPADGTGEQAAGGDTLTPNPDEAVPEDDMSLQDEVGQAKEAGETDHQFPFGF